MKIEFTHEYTVQPNGPSYAVGDVINVKPASAEHFKRKGVAHEVGNRKPVTIKAENEAKKPIVEDKKKALSASLPAAPVLLETTSSEPLICQQSPSTPTIK